MTETPVIPTNCQKTRHDGAQEETKKPPFPCGIFPCDVRDSIDSNLVLIHPSSFKFLSL